MVNWTIKNLGKALEAVRNGSMTQIKAALTYCENIYPITIKNLSSSHSKKSRFTPYDVKSSLNINHEHVVNQWLTF